MCHAALVVLFLLMSMPAAYEARRILHGKEQNLTTKNQLLLGSLLHIQGQVPKISVSNPSNTSKTVYVAPSAPNPGTHIPSSTKPPHPYMLHEAYYVPPPIPGTHIPNSMTSNITVGTPWKSPLMSPSKSNGDTSSIP